MKRTTEIYETYTLGNANNVEPGDLAAIFAQIGKDYPDYRISAMQLSIVQLNQSKLHVVLMRR